MSRRRPPMLLCSLPVHFEKLEPRRLFAITLDANGFSQFDSSGKTIVYVSSSTGSDSNNGLSPGSPVQTVNKAKSMVNNGQADWMLLKRGDVFGPIGTWTKSGASASDPVVIGAYGTSAPGQDPRTVIHTGVGGGLQTIGGGGAVNNFAIVGIHFFPEQYNGVNGSFDTTAIRLLKQGSGILVEDVMIEGFKDGITLQGDGTAIDGFTLRRSVIVDSYAASGAVGNGHAQGLYVSGSSKNILIEENVFDHNGWKEGVAAPTVFNHDIYVNTGAQGVVVRGNIISRASENGILLRAGGCAQDNLIIRSSVGVIVGQTSSVVTGNVVLEGVDLPDLAQGLGINTVNMPTLLVENNIVAHDTSNFTSNVAAIVMQWGIGGGRVGDNIVFDWRHSLSSGGASVQVDNNQFQEIDAHHPVIDQRDNGNYSYQNNIYSSPAAAPFHRVTSDLTFAQWQSTVEPSAQNVQLNYLDPWRDVGTYGSTFAGTDGTFDGWINGARANSSQNWNPALMAKPAEDWIREGFTILGQGDPGGSNGRVIVNVTATDPFAKEPKDSVNPGTFTFTRTGPTTNPLKVTFGLLGTADPIDDYVPFNKLEVTFPAGQSTVSANLNPIWDQEVEGNETVTVELNAGAGYEIGPRKRDGDH